MLVSEGIHPEYREVIRTYLVGLDAGAPKMQDVPLDKATGATDLDALQSLLDDDVCAVLAGYPNFYGVVEPLDRIAALAHEAGALAVSATAEPFAMGVLTSPGDLDIDIAVGEGQPLGTSLSFGGPGLGLFSCRDDRKLLRQMPGRLVGQTVDTEGKMGFVLTLATREQHIRREKATSNICTNHGLCALSVAIQLSLLGKTGFEQVARSCFSRAEYLKAAIKELPGFSLPYTGATFNEFAVRCERTNAADVLNKLLDLGFLGGVDLGRFDPKRADTFLIATSELHNRKKLDAYLDALRSL